jgi:inorganic phosphate transporter, PiT family
MSQELLIVIVLALLFGLLNGARDASNIVATMISSRAFSPHVALGITAVAEFFGPFLFGVVVARTIGDQVVQSSALTLTALTACLLGAILWGLLTWFLGIPGSSSHALIGGMIGVVFVDAGLDAIKLVGLYKVLLALLASPLIGFAFGFLITRVLFFLVRNATPRVNTVFRNGQLFTALALALSHGTNDSQKVMGIITLSLVVGGVLPAFEVPFWVIVASAAGIALGSGFGGWRLIRTLGGKFYKIRPVHSFSTQLTSAFVILSASLFGVPVSTSQVVSSAIVGVGASERFGKVRWGVVGDILTSWIITIPASALLSAGVFQLMMTLR